MTYQLRARLRTTEGYGLWSAKSAVVTVRAKKRVPNLPVFAEVNYDSPEDGRATVSIVYRFNATVDELPLLYRLTFQSPSGQVYSQVFNASKYLLRSIATQKIVCVFAFVYCLAVCLFICCLFVF